MIPQTYTQRRRCIEVDCGLTLTPDFVDARINALTASGAGEPARFAPLYGEAHLHQVISWFRNARTSPAALTGPSQ